MTSLGGYFLETPELRRRGLTVGENVSISSTVCIYGDYSNLKIGNHVRIDDYVVILANGPVTLGSYIHVSPFCYFQGGGGLYLDNFVAMGSHCSLMTNGSDVSGEHLTGVTPPKETLGGDKAPIYMGLHSFLCAGVTVNPGTTICEGSVIAANSFVKGYIDSWGFYGGCPAKFLKRRNSSKILELAKGLIVNH